MSHDDPIDGDDGLISEAQVTEAYEALGEMIADQRLALREAVALPLEGGTAALRAAEDRIRSRLSEDGAYALSVLIEEMFPERDGVYWARDREGELDA